MPSLLREFLRLKGKLNVALNRQPVEQPGVLEDITDARCGIGRGRFSKNLNRAALMGLMRLDAGDDV